MSSEQKILKKNLDLLKTYSINVSNLENYENDKKLSNLNIEKIIEKFNSTDDNYLKLLLHQAIIAYNDLNYNTLNEEIFYMKINNLYNNWGPEKLDILHDTFNKNIINYLNKTDIINTEILEKIFDDTGLDIKKQRPVSKRPIKKLKKKEKKKQLEDLLDSIIF